MVFHLDYYGAARTEAFERALILRDRLQVLQWLHGHLERLRHAQERHSFLYRVTDEARTTTWYFVRRGRVVGAMHEPCDPGSWEAARLQIRALFAAKGPNGPPSLEEVDGMLLVAAWFRRHPDERAHTWSPKAALALCRQRYPRAVPENSNVTTP